MRKLVRPSLSDLQPFIKEATTSGQVPEKEWVKKMSATLASILREDMRSYRAFGPYWWIAKKILTAHGHDFGERTDSEWIEICDYGDEFLSLLTAFLYADGARQCGLIYSDIHNIAFEEDDGTEAPYEFVLTDLDMEYGGAMRSMNLD